MFCGFKKSILLVLFIIFAAFFLQAQNNIEEKIYIPDARTSALGGTHAALADDFSTLFSNPAGFNTVDTEILLSGTTIGLKGPIFDIAGVVVQALSADITDLFASSTTQNLLKNIYAGMDLIGPLYFGYVGNGLGFGFFNTTDVTFRSSGPLTLSSLVSEQIVLYGGYAYRVPLPEISGSKLDIGILLKGALKGEVEISKSFLELPELFTSISADTIMEEPFNFISLIGFDLGIRYTYRDVLSIGIVGKDIFTPTLKNTYSSLNSFINNSGETPVESKGLVPLSLNAGILYSPSFKYLERYITNLKIMLDYSDILDFLMYPEIAVNPLLHIGFGTEVTMLEMLALRAGFYQGLFSAGLGMDLKYFNLDVAMFGTENSSEPGLNPVYNIIIGLKFGF